MQKLRFDSISWRALCVCLVACLVASSCASDPPKDDAPSGTSETTGDTSPGEDTGTGEDASGGEDATDDTGGGDDVGTEDVPDRPKVGFGEPCQENLDCEAGYCVSSSRGFICTQPCEDDASCPLLGDQTMECRSTENFGPDGTRLCAPAETSLCQPCFQDSNCFGGRCVTTTAGNYCGTDCGDQDSCPEGQECFRFSPLGDPLPVPQCLPSNLSCGCTEETAGEERACVRSDGASRRCFGVETCDPERGWVGCDAPIPDFEVCDGVDNDCNGAIDDGLEQSRSCEAENDLGVCTGLALCEGEDGWVCRADEPTAEVCDAQDNDCDGLFDEDFRDDNGLLSSVEHCGLCGNDCRDRFDLAADVTCSTSSGAPLCEITECLPGYTLAGPQTCLPLTSNLCQPCESDDGCNTAVGDRCLTYPGGAQFCGRSCAPDSPFGAACPQGYVCNDDDQCQLETGTCLCGPGDSFIRSCSIPDPNDPQNNCVGTLTCDDGSLSACVPEADTCNGFDDDCDGVIDNDFRDPDTGAYTQDEHCGACNTNCILLFDDPMFRGDGFCTGAAAVEQGEDPTCSLRCDPGWRNINGVVSDGCECQLLDENDDVPDLEGVDANCDGIDGVVERGWFVSPTGNDDADGTLDNPLQTIQVAIDRAGPGRDHVYVAAGVYSTSLTLRPGVSVFGGYSSDFRQRDIDGNETAIFAPAPTPDAPGAVNANGIQDANPSIFSGFTVQGANNPTSRGNSYVFYLQNCTSGLVLEGNVIRAGNGGNGVKGGSGTEGDDAPNSATSGAVARTSQNSSCSNSAANRSPGGQGATHSCTSAQGASIDASGGDGGTADCPVYNQPEASGADGAASGGRPRGGSGGYNQELVDIGASCACLIPTVEGSTEVGVSGDDGDNGADGNSGLGCPQSRGSVESGHWIAGVPNAGANTPSRGNGASGILGNPGEGGGGGGAGSGVAHGSSNTCNNFFDEVLGGGGGGGGAGGCGGTGGNGGTGGGGSFGLFLSYDAPPTSLPLVRSNTIERGFGGVGGDGGEGADGGQGSSGAAALVIPDDELSGLLVCSDPGGRGGDGGNGGAGGGGGGGCGGISAGIFLHNAGPLPTQPLADNNTFPTTGGAGEGGRGGVSNGNIGVAGSNGIYVEVTP